MLSPGRPPLHAIGTPTDRCHQVSKPDTGDQDPRTGRLETGYTADLLGQPADFIIGAYHQLWCIEKAFRMLKHDLQTRPIYHRTRDSIEAHLSVVFATMASASPS